MVTVPFPCLMHVTDRTLLAPNWTLAQAVAPAITGGVNLVHFREVDLPAGPRTTMFRFLGDGVGSRAPIIAAGMDASFALAVGADGAHLEDPFADIAAARGALGPERLLGVTVTDLDSLSRAPESGADYGLVVVDWSDVEAAISTVRAFTSRSRIPLIVGLDMPIDQVSRCMAAGAHGVAVCRPVMASENRTAAARAHAAALKRNVPDV